MLLNYNFQLFVLGFIAAAQGAEVIAITLTDNRPFSTRIVIEPDVEYRSLERTSTLTSVLATSTSGQISTPAFESLPRYIPSPLLQSSAQASSPSMVMSTESATPTLTGPTLFTLSHSMSSFVSSSSPLSQTSETSIPLPFSKKSSKSSLSAGAKAGIAIGAILGAAALSLSAFFLGIRFRTQILGNNSELGLRISKAELDGKPIFQMWPSELDSKSEIALEDAHELPGDFVPAEMD
ncbi:uncharacterized protein BDR25DRAFT_132066 [Lindgomyces ingoldianus]|uniref:Uncharacterized protein n=1 Tax=Lindgomyces ingoldianus TaxID=673940 RepID=A0ACB6R4R2_9PLEO|nr:uncharacterized protein BDR25DRAFT_132066 [Lindgomyces ingoldianus]KAF2473436.1 hypothetical protein BDR25DRAFT_132066 [Lindgomyces ingoldianus]